MRVHVIFVKVLMTPRTWYAVVKLEGERTLAFKAGLFINNADGLRAGSLFSKGSNDVAMNRFHFTDAKFGNLGAGFTEGHDHFIGEPDSCSLVIWHQTMTLNLNCSPPIKEAHFH